MIFLRKIRKMVHFSVGRALPGPYSSILLPTIYLPFRSTLHTEKPPL